MAEDIERIANLPPLPGRKRDGHKGDYGRVLVVGGSRGMIGAAALASSAALRGGAGLVTLAVPETIQLAVAALSPCATSIPLACDAEGALARESIRQVVTAAAGSDVLAVGPGMDVAGPQQNLVRAALAETKPVVLDADGLNNLANIDAWPALRRCPLVLTPHPGEFARLTGCSVQQIQSDRQAAVVAAARQWIDQHARDHLPLVCVLKGAGTVVTDGRRLFVNDTGNPGMATSGSGDVLTGLVAAFIAQGMEIFAAASGAVRIHGRAGDLAAERLGQVSVTATDILADVSQAIRESTSQE